MFGEIAKLLREMIGHLKDIVALLRDVKVLLEEQRARRGGKQS